MAAEVGPDQDLAELLSLAAEQLQHGDGSAVPIPEGLSAGDALRELLPTVRNLFTLCRPSAESVNGDDNGTDPPLGSAHPERRIGDFRLLREIGRGGMGVVYEAEQVSLGRRVALKILSVPGQLDDRRRQRFATESRAAAGLRHPHLVPVYTAGHEDGVLYYAMQLIDGCTLADVIARLGDADPEAAGPNCPPLPEAGSEGHYRLAARLTAEAALALDYAHQLGIVHRDVKPGNLMLDREGWLWVTDFGLAITPQADELTATGDRVGTARYMSPEQAAGRRGLIDQRTDVYSLGLTLYELLVLRPAFGGDPDDLLRVGDCPPPLRKFAPRVPAELRTVVEKAVESDPADRYQTAQELADDLNRFLAGQPVLARRPGWTRWLWRWAGRNRLKLALTTVAALLLAAAAATSWVVTRQALAMERRARSQEKARIRESHAIVQSTLLRVAGDREIRDPAFERLRREFVERGENYLERFLRDHRDDPAFEQELACAVAQLAEMRRALGRPAEAVPLYEEALGRYRRLAEYAPEPERSAYRRHIEQVRQALADCRTSKAR